VDVSISVDTEVLARPAARFLAPAVLAACLLACDGAATSTAVEVPCDLAPGDLLVTEIMARPVPADRRVEWFELLNPTPRRLDLAGVVLEAGSLSNPRKHRIPALLDPGLDPGGRLAIGNGLLDDGITGYAWPQLMLADDGATLTVRCGAVVVDRVSWGGTGSGPGRAVEGVSWQRSSRTLPPPGLSTNPDGGATTATWCLAADDAVYDAPGDRGTPGAPNRDCPLPGECREDGAWRVVVAPSEGDLVLTEVFANPTGADDPRKEWVEVLAIRDADLNGLSLVNRQGGHVRSFPIDSSACLAIRAGARALLAGSADPSANGGLPSVAHAFGAGLPLYDGLATLSLETTGGVTVATAAPPPSLEGASRSLRPDPVPAPAPASIPGNWCAGTRAGLFDGLGTPGAQNDPCP